MFYTVNKQGNAVLFEDDGTIVTYLQELICLKGGLTTPKYECPEGVVLTVEEAERLGISEVSLNCKQKTSILQDVTTKREFCLRYNEETDEFETGFYRLTKGETKMIQRTLQEWCNFTGMFGAMDDNGECYLYEKKTRRSSHAWEYHDKSFMLNISGLVSETDTIHKYWLYAPIVEMKENDKVLCWRKDWQKDVFADIGYFVSAQPESYEARASQTQAWGKSYDRCIHFDKELAGLTVEELEELM